MNALEKIGEYGASIDAPANAFLTRNDYGMYGMMRYFMGFANEQFENANEKTGKRFRPGILLYLADCFGVKSEALPAALSIELFHNFTLIHDDIVDQDELRHGRSTVWKVWGKDHAINTGDGQFALSLLALYENNHLAPEHLQSIEKSLLASCLEIIEGQFLDFTLTDLPLSDERVNEEAYLTMIEKKTAVLVAASTRVAGMIAKKSDEQTKVLDELGRNIGMAYQLYDDIQSIWGSQEKTGKDFAGDIRERKKTLPVIYAREHLATADAATFTQLYATHDTSDETTNKLLKLIDITDARAYATQKMDSYKQAAFDNTKHIELSDEEKKFVTETIDELMVL